MLLAGTCLRAQENGDSPVPVSAAPPAEPGARQPATAPLEERIAAARSVRVVTSILGIELGSELDEAHEKLDPLCAPGTRPKEEGGDDEKKPAEKGQASGAKKEKDGDERARRERQPKAGEEQEAGHKVLWQLAGTDYSAIYITADDQERIDSITGFLRPEKQMPFDAVGEVSKAPLKDNNTVIWDVLRPDQPLFRVAAQGSNGKAGSIRIFVVRQKPGSQFPDSAKVGGTR